jgi:alanine-glyoxylate transaminase/serine-glyoxylate transaminase/serine-pyruvate transaminase
MITKYWSGKSRVYHHTAPINMLYGLYQACFNIIDEGLEVVIQRHTDMHHMLVDELSNLDLQLFVNKHDRLPMLNSVVIPDGANDVEVRSRLLNEYQIEIGGGLGPLAGRIWRIGLMGETAKKESIQKLMDAFRKILN